MKIAVSIHQMRRIKNKMVEINVGLLIFIIIMVAGVCITVESLVVNGKNSFYKNTIKEISEELRNERKVSIWHEHLPGICNCKSCGNDHIALEEIIITRSSLYHSGPCNSVMTNIDSEYKVMCERCGLQTKSYSQIIDAITAWNGVDTTERIEERDN